MTSIPEPAEALQQILEEKAVRLARETGFIERERTFTGADFAQALILGWLHRPDERIDGFVQVLERREVSITGNIQGNTYANAGIQQTTINSLNNFINGPAPGAGLSPSSLSFGAQVINTTSTAQSAILTNNGTLPLSISSIGLSGTNAADFAQTNTCPISPNTLAVNAACTISVTFSPTANGSRSASVTITDNATTSPQSVALSGTGITPTIYFWNSTGGTYSLFTPANALTANTWYSVEVQDTETTTGHGEVWLNGTSVGSFNADLSTATPYARLMLFDSAPGTIYFDDVQVAGTYI